MCTLIQGVDSLVTSLSYFVNSNGVILSTSLSNYYRITNRVTRGKIFICLTLLNGYHERVKKTVNVRSGPNNAGYQICLYNGWYHCISRFVWVTLTSRVVIVHVESSHSLPNRKANIPNMTWVQDDEISLQCTTGMQYWINQLLLHISFAPIWSMSCNPRTPDFL